MNRNEHIGQTGEDRVCALHETIPNTMFFRNVYIPCGNGRTAQIDALLLSPKEIFAVEIKHWRGEIRGSMRNHEWSQTYRPRGSKTAVKRKLHSPVKQSAAHAAALAKWLRVPASRCHSFIVFTQNARQKKVPANTPEFTIAQSSMLRSSVLWRLNAIGTEFDPEELERMKNMLRQLPPASEALKSRHTKQAQAAERRRKTQ